MTGHGLANTLGLLFPVADLHSGVAVLIRCFDLKDMVSACFDNSGWSHTTLFIIDAGHAEFFSEKSDAHGLKLDFDCDVDACRKIELTELVHRFGGGLDDVEKAFVGADLKLIHGFFVNVRGAVDCEALDASGERDRAGDFGSGALGSFDDFRGRGVENAIVECLEANPDFLTVLCCHD